jgi:hypothetical protein
MKILANSLLSSIAVLAALAWPQTSTAQTVPLLFQTTFNCADWNQSMGLGESNVCSSGDGIAGNGGWTSPGHPLGDEITSAANNPAGGGGKGFRHWVADGVNSGGGGIRILFPARSEVWIRYYIRYQSGFAWGSSTFHKHIYVNQGAPGTFYFGLHSGLVGGHVERDQTNGGNKQSSVTWANMQGGSTGDGSWHSLEVHARMNSSGASSDGVLEFWLDGTKIYSNSSIHFSDSSGATFAEFFTSNHNAPQNGGDFYVDYDDIAVSASGYIGTIGTPGLPAPRNLRVQ